MKKILLLISCLIISIATAFAVEGLNPYAYKLEYHGQSDNNRKMTLKYWLNAPAKSVSITVSYMLDDAQQVVSYEGTTNEGENTVTVSTAGLPANTPLSWSVTVNQTTKTEPTQVSTNYRLYCPQGIAIDKDPQSEYFGRILVTESLHKRTGTSGRNYISSTSATGGEIQAGIYAFNPQFQLINDKGVPYTGGKNFKQKLGKFESESGYGNFDGGHQPYQIKISDDGRIFISCGDLRDAGAIIWEATKDLETWYPIIRNGGTIGWNKTKYQLYDADGKFYAGFNCSMDVKGTGEDLKLLLYSTDYDGVHSNHIKNFRLDEYAIGKYTGNDFAGTITSIWKPGDRKYGVVYDKVNVIYDYDGGYWFSASRGSKDNTTEPNIVHVSKNGTESNKSYSNTLHGGAGIIMHKPTYEDYLGDTWLIKGVSGEQFTIFRIYLENGVTKMERVVTTSSTGMGYCHNAFAIDYAENLYAVGNVGERIIAFSLPYSGTKTTPARSIFKLAAVDNSQTFAVNTSSTPSGYGSTSGDGLYHYEESVTVTAKSADNDRYKFKEWQINGNKVSSDSIYTFTVSSAVNLTAVFEEKIYRVEYFNLFQNKEDITTYWTANDQIDHERNSRLWRLFQVEYNKMFKSDNHRYYDYGEKNKSRYLYYVLKFVNKDTINTTQVSRATMRANIETFLDTESSPMYWLGQYIENYVDKDINHVEVETDKYVNVWGFYLQSFINRTIHSHDQDLKNSYAPTGTATIASGYLIKDFSEVGNPENWRPWWQEHAIKLPLYTTYQPVPTEWTEPERPVGWSIADKHNNSVTYNPCETWYKWNDAAANPGKLLGWYYGEKNPDTWTDNPDEVDIVHNINKNGNLIAIWVPKDIHEEKNNYDVTKLMTTQGTTHDVRVYHRLQANMYNTICLPFNVTNLPGNLAGSTVLRLVSSDLENEELSEETLSDNNVNLYFEQVDFTKGEQMYAGYPYLIMPQSDVTDWVTFTGVDRDSVYTGEGKSFVTDYVAMHGHINPSEIDVDPNTLFLVANNRLATPSESGVMLGLRGYFTLEGSAAAYSLGEQSVMHIGKKVTTDTPDAPEVEEEVETTQPATPKTSKIMYQGKIYILRGDEVYTITGHRVK